MLYHFLQGYTDAIHIAVHLRVPKEPRHGLFPTPAVPIEAQVATCFERLFGGASWLIRAAARLPRWLRRNAAGIARHRAPARTLAIVIAGALAAIVALISSNAGATILIFNQARSVTGADVVPIRAGAPVPQDYGDRVTGNPMAVPGGTFTYGNGGEGFTPNVVADYFSGNNVSLWTTEYGDLTNVMFASPGSNAMSLRLSADPGFDVLLYGFDLAGWPLSDYTINGVTITGGGTTLFSQSTVLVEGNATGPGHTSFDFASPLIGADLLIGIDFANIIASQQDNIAIDNVRFGQSPPPNVTPTQIPEPGSLALLGMGLALVGRIRRRPGAEGTRHFHSSAHGSPPSPVAFRSASRHPAGDGAFGRGETGSSVRNRRRPRDCKEIARLQERHWPPSVKSLGPGRRRWEEAPSQETGRHGVQQLKGGGGPPQRSFHALSFRFHGHPAHRNGG